MSFDLWFFQEKINQKFKMNTEDLYQTFAIVLVILNLNKVDITQMMSSSWKELIFLAFVFITVLYLPFPYGIILQIICKGMELLVGHLCKTRCRHENEKPGNEKLNSRFFFFSSAPGFTQMADQKFHSFANYL